MKKSFPLFLLLCTLLSLKVSGQCTLSFSDNFETGAPSPIWQIGTGHTMAVTNVAPAAGIYSLNLAGSSSFYQGPTAPFTSSQPTYVSWRIKTNNTAVANGYFVLGDANINSDNGILFAYCNSGSSLRFFGTTGYNHPMTANTWYHVEAKNINWTNRNMDIYVNGVLILPGWPFRSPTATSMDRLCIFNLNSATSSFDNIIIGWPGPAVSNVVTTPILCNGGNSGGIDITVTPPSNFHTYSWSTGATTQDVTGLSAGTYSVTVTDSLGCSITSTTNLTQPTAVTVTTTASPNIICPNACSQLTVTPSGGVPGYMISWAPSSSLNNPVSFTPTACPTTTTTYTASVTDANGCMATSTVTVNVNAIGTLLSSNNASCFGSCDGIAAVTASGNGPFTFLWNDPGAQTTQTATGLCAGTYTVNVTGAGGCTATASVIIGQPAPLSVVPVVVNNISCANCCDGELSGNVTGGTPPYTFLWSPGNYTTINISNLCSGTYTFCVTDANGCTSCTPYTLSFTVGTNQLSAPGSQITVFPNPFTETITLGEIEIGTVVTLYTVTGEKVQTCLITSVNQELKTNNLSPGIYILEANAPSGIQRIRILKE